MVKIDLDKTEVDLKQIINDIENKTVTKYVIYKDNKPCAIVAPYEMATEDDIFPQIGDEDWDKLDDDMKKYWSDFGDEEI